MGLDPEYVLDKMKWYEATQFLKYKYLKSKEGWQQTRWYGNLYINAHSKRKFTLEETIEFPWEKEERPKLTKEQVEAERKLAEAEAQRVAEMLKNAKLSPVTQHK